MNFILKKYGKIKKISQKKKENFLKNLVYFRGDFDRPESFNDLTKVLCDAEGKKHACSNLLFYFSTSPHHFFIIAHLLKDLKLMDACQVHGRKTRVLVEKPFGFNLKSARALNKLLLKYFKEEQIYRIDHYVGKETVQNLMVVRFANSLFEPLWNNRFIDHVEISVLEQDSAEDRIAYYDQTGAIKDFLQNHILQMLALIAMDEPYNLTADHIRDEKLKVLNALESITPEKLPLRLVKAQYQGYQKDAAMLNKQAGRSDTETYFALKTYVNLPRWQGVPFYLRNGKKLSKKLTEISVHFKEPIRCLFEGCGSNVLTFQIQPNESVRLQINNKIPGFGIKLSHANLDFSYKMQFKGEIPGAYERLLLDFLEGDQRLYIRSDEIEAAWKFVDGITENPAFKDLKMHEYKPGTNGPKAADEFIQKDLREWRAK